MRKKREKKTKWERKECRCPVFWAITHQTSPPSPARPPQSLKKQNNVLTWRWRGAEGRAAGEGGKLGNQMWSIKTYWHAKGLPLPHLHTESTNSCSSRRCTHICMHMSHAGPYTPHTHMHTHRHTSVPGSGHVCTVNLAKWLGLKNKHPTVVHLHMPADFFSHKTCR